jgi:hypothetical protein
MALESTQSLREMSTRGQVWPAHKADNLTAICEPIAYKMWEIRRLTTLWSSMACYMDSFYICQSRWPILFSFRYSILIRCYIWKAKVN